MRLPPGAAIHVCLVATYARNAGFFMAARAISARSYGELVCPTASSPFTLTAWVSLACSRSASAFICRAVRTTPPFADARVSAASFAEATSIARNSSGTG